MKTTKCYTQNKDGSPHLWYVSDIPAATNSRPARILWESDFRAMMKIVRMDAASQCRALGGDCGKCGPCLARKLMKEKR